MQEFQRNKNYASMMNKPFPFAVKYLSGPLGISIEPNADSSIKINSLIPGGHSIRAGVNVGDYLIAIDGIPISDILKASNNLSASKLILINILKEGSFPRILVFESR